MAANELAIRPTSWVGRASLWALRVVRAVAPIERPEQFEAGNGFATGRPADSTYDQLKAMSAYPANGWLYSAIDAITTDTSGLPIRISRKGDRDALIENHPFIDLISNPNGNDAGMLLRAQLWADWHLAGDAYILVLVGARGPDPVALVRMHPKLVKPVPAEDGSVQSYEYRLGDDGKSNPRYDASAVEHIRGVSWEMDPRGLHGTGLVQPIDADLTASIAATRAGERAFKKGRPDAVYSPAKDDTVWNRKQVADMASEMSKLLNDADGGVALLSGAGKLSPLGWSPKDMEGEKQQVWTRSLILAVTSVPPARVGLETTNYATAESQMQAYWQGLRGKAAIVEEAYTRIANRFAGFGEVEVWHDFSGIEWVQKAVEAAKNAALDRVEKHIKNGMGAEWAYQYEGFDDVEPGWFVAPEVETLEPEDEPDNVEDIEEARAEVAAALEVLESGKASTGAQASALCGLREALVLLPVKATR